MLYLDLGEDGVSLPGVLGESPGVEAVAHGAAGRRLAVLKLVHVVVERREEVS